MSVMRLRIRRPCGSAAGSETSADFQPATVMDNATGLGKSGSGGNSTDGGTPARKARAEPPRHTRQRANGTTPSAPSQTSPPLNTATLERGAGVGVGVGKTEGIAGRTGAGVGETAWEPESRTGVGGRSAPLPISQPVINPRA